jgi:hypothetical protein
LEIPRTRPFASSSFRVSRPARLSLSNSEGGKVEVSRTF